MFNRFTTIVAVMALSSSILSFQTNTYKDISANPVILDMDFSTDVDDAVAVRVATLLDKSGACTLKAVGLCTVDPLGKDRNINAMHTILAYDGYGNIPVGTPSKKDMEGSRYWDVIQSSSVVNTKDSVALYKEILSNCINPVTIITTGYLNNIQALLEDPEGYSLMSSNCKKLVITGGAFPRGNDHNFDHTETAKASSEYVNKNCPCTIVYVPNDVGGDFYVGKVIQTNYPNDPVAKALNAWGSDNIGRTAWDPISVFVGIVPEALGNFEYLDCRTYVSGGNNEFDTSAPSGRTKVVRRLGNVDKSSYHQLIEGLLGADSKYAGNVRPDTVLSPVEATSESQSGDGDMTSENTQDGENGDTTPEETKSSAKYEAVKRAAVKGRQGIACDENYYYVSDVNALIKYDRDWNEVKVNDNPFEDYDAKVDRIGDIDVYDGEIYLCTELFTAGIGKNIQIMVHDAENLELKRRLSFKEGTGQTEVSGICVNPEAGTVILCSRGDKDSGRYLYIYDLDTGKYLRKVHLQMAPQWINGIAYHDGYVYLSSDDGTADETAENCEYDHIYRTKIVKHQSYCKVTEEMTFETPSRPGEISGIAFDEKENRFLILHNHGAKIDNGKIKGLYEGYEKEKHDVYIYDME